MTRDEIFMKRAIELASLADSSVFPNPYVGAVITLNDEIIAEGYHRSYGQPHAEVNAVNQVAEKSFLSKCTIYVTLEPCAHFGQTPPCADLLILHRFQRVVIGSIDPFAEVNGLGIERLKAAGIQVEIGVLKAECDKLNERFFTYHKQKRPFIILKWAESKDGFIALEGQGRGERTRITGVMAHQLVHLQRAREHAILIGRKTAELDNPGLDVRLIQGKNPVRVVLDSQLQLSKSLKIFTDGNPTIVLNHKFEGEEGAIRYICMDKITPASIGAKLYDLHILSVYIEGGANTLQQFIDANLWDRAYRFLGATTLFSGVQAPSLTHIDQQCLVTKSELESDALLTYENTLV